MSYVVDRLEWLHELMTDGGTERMSDWEQSFVDKVYKQDYEMTPAQEAKVNEIYLKVRGHR